ncbi:MAG: thermonuclease family protein [Ruegeria sp.]|uniref:thermonuclease family protein n=1 Tax=Ruegeria sp. TaxID=1879320 RepID=UPI00349E94F5
MPLLPSILNPRLYLRAVLAAMVVSFVLFQILPDLLLWSKDADQDDRCRIVSITDGNTVRTWCPARGVEVGRLQGFSAPKLYYARCKSEFLEAFAARRALRLAVMGAKDVTIVREGKDVDKRALIKVWLDGRSLASLMVETGHARPHSGRGWPSWCH